MVDIEQIWVGAIVYNTQHDVLASIEKTRPKQSRHETLCIYIYMHSNLSYVCCHMYICMYMHMRYIRYGMYADNGWRTLFAGVPGCVI